MNRASKGFKGFQTVDGVGFQEGLRPSRVASLGLELQRVSEGFRWFRVSKGVRGFQTVEGVGFKKGVKGFQRVSAG